MAAYSITENHLCFVCHGKPDKCQEDLDCGCCRPDDAFLCVNKWASQQSKICWNTYAKALPRLLYIFKICVTFSQQPWRGISAPENDSRYTSSIITDIAV